MDDERAARRSELSRSRRGWPGRRAEELVARPVSPTPPSSAARGLLLLAAFAIRIVREYQRLVCPGSGGCAGSADRARPHPPPETEDVDLPA